MNLTFETARAQSELFTFQCSQWELIWNSQLIGRYKEMSPGESYDIHPPTTLLGQLQLTFLRFQLYQVTLLIAPPTTLPQQLQFTFLIFSALPGNSANWPPHTTTLPGQLQLTFLRFQLYQVTLLIYIQIPKTDMRKSQFYLGTYI